MGGCLAVPTGIGREEGGGRASFVGCTGPGLSDAANGTLAWPWLGRSALVLSLSLSLFSALCSSRRGP